MNFPKKYSVSNSNTLVSFTPSIEKKTVDDVCLNTSSFLEIVQVPGLKQSIETFPFPPGTTSASKRKKRVNWTNMEDNSLFVLMKDLGPYKPNWSKVASQLNETFKSNRTGKQCRERWLNHLRPDIKKGDWSSEEERMIRFFHASFGPKWSTMAKLMKNRTDNDIKNKWNSMKRTEEVGRLRKNSSSRSTTKATSKISAPAVLRNGKRSRMQLPNSRSGVTQSARMNRKMPPFGFIPDVGQHFDLSCDQNRTQSSAPSTNVPFFKSYKTEPFAQSSQRANARMDIDGGRTENSPVPENSDGESYRQHEI